jgi:hypothetical protein
MLSRVVDVEFEDEEVHLGEREGDFLDLQVRPPSLAWICTSMPCRRFLCMWASDQLNMNHKQTSACQSSINLSTISISKANVIQNWSPWNMEFRIWSKRSKSLVISSLPVCSALLQISTAVSLRQTRVIRRPYSKISRW